jgi:hypothetical protein
VEGSLADAVTPDELTMQKFWPAHDAVAKLRHEATISEMRTSARNIPSTIQSLTDRLDRIERSTSAVSTSSPPPPPPAPPVPPVSVWVEQGTTGIWIGPIASVRPGADGSRSIQVPLSDSAASLQSQSHVGHSAASTSAAQADGNGDGDTLNNSQSLLFVRPRNRSLRIA